MGTRCRRNPTSPSGDQAWPIHMDGRSVQSLDIEVLQDTANHPRLSIEGISRLPIPFLPMVASGCYQVSSWSEPLISPPWCKPPKEERGCRKKEVCFHPVWTKYIAQRNNCSTNHSTPTRSHHQFPPSLQHRHEASSL